jgi:acyl carrier protein
MNFAPKVVAAVRPEISEIFHDVFQYDGPVTRKTCPDDVARWDSLQHIALVRAIEHTFDISMSMDEMAEMRSAGDIETILSRYGV